MLQFDRLRQRVLGLSHEQRKMLAAKLAYLQTAETVAEKEVTRTNANLTIFFSTVNGAHLEREDLKQFLRKSLPNYMMPARLIHVPEIPRLPNGKVDATALSNFPTTERCEPPDGAAMGGTEQSLAKIWQEVLQVDEITGSDNFFELGGDSILSILMVSKARQAGLSLAPNDIFEAPTIAELAVRCAPEVPTALTQSLPDAPLTPIQHWFFDQNLLCPEHWNQNIALDLEPGITPGIVRRAVAELIKRHDGLRISFKRNGEVAHQVFSDDCPTPFRHFDLTKLPASDRSERRAELIQEQQLLFDLDRTPLIQFTLFTGDAGEISRLVITAHHLLVDAISWHTLIEDLDALCARELDHKQGYSTIASTPFSVWSKYLASLADQNSVLDASEFWLQMANHETVTIPVDNLDAIPREGTLICIERSLDNEQSAILFDEANHKYSTSVLEILLTALGRSLANWTGRSSTAVGIEGHGRDIDGDSPDVSRTIGWFTAYYPLLLEVTNHDISSDIKAIKQRVRSVPHHGVSYGILKYLTESRDRNKLAEQPSAQILFNYLGCSDQIIADSNLLKLVNEEFANERAPENTRAQLLDINCSFRNGQFQARFSFDRNFHHAATIVRLADDYFHQLTSVIRHCVTTGVRSFTPSDFPEMKFRQDELDEFVARFGDDLEAVIPLTLNQQALLVRSLQPKSEDPGQLVVRMSFAGTLNYSQFVEAWKYVVEKHQVLRTSFHWDDLAQPVQIVRTHSEIDIAYHDLSLENYNRQLQVLDHAIADSKHEAAALNETPTFKVTVYQLSPDTFECLWSCHHIMLDGWSSAIVIRDVLEYCNAEHDAKRMPPKAIVSYREYIAWLVRQDLRAGHDFWRDELDGLEPSTARFAGAPNTTRTAAKIAHQAVKNDEIAAVARRCHATPSDVLMAAWALIVGALKQTDEVIFAAVVSGRAVPSMELDSTVGLLANTVPIRVRLDPNESLVDLIRQVHKTNRAVQQHEYITPGQIQSWGLLNSTNMPDSLIVFENFPIDLNAAAPDTPLKLTSFGGGLTTTYPLTLVVIPGDEFEITLLTDEGWLAGDMQRMLLGDLEKLLEFLCMSKECTVKLARDIVDQSARVLRDDLVKNQAERSLAPSKIAQDKGEVPSALVRHIAGIWASALGHNIVNPHDNFFDLGGTSLIAVEVLGEIEKTFGERLPLDALWITDGTVYGLSELLNRNSASIDWPMLIHIAGSGGEAPLYCVHTAGGNLFHYYELANQLNFGGPVLGVQAPGVYGNGKPDIRLEAIARSCVDTILKHQPDGPYRLAGFSSGGLVAYEIAQQLRAAGKEIEFLGLIDSYVHYYPLIHRPFTQIKEMFAADNWRTVQELLYFSVLTTLRLSKLRDLREIGEAHRWAHWAYEPLIFKGDAELFLGAENTQQNERVLTGWEHLIQGNLNVHHITGKHGQIVKSPHVELLAEKIRALLRR